MADLYTLPNATGGADAMLIGIATAVPQVIPAMLFLIWCVVFFGGSATQQARAGYSDFASWSFVASILTSFVTLIFSLKEGLMNSTIFSFVISLTILCGVWFFFSRGRLER